jgi:hypothetical protein
MFGVFQNIDPTPLTAHCSASVFDERKRHICRIKREVRGGGGLMFEKTSDTALHRCSSAHFLVKALQTVGTYFSPSTLLPDGRILGR